MRTIRMKDILAEGVEVLALECCSQLQYSSRELCFEYEPSQVVQGSGRRKVAATLPRESPS